MLKWLVQRIPDPAGDTGSTPRVNTTDDPLATIDLGTEAGVVSTSAWSFGKVTGKGSSGGQEIYSVNRTNPLYVDDNDVDQCVVDGAEVEILEAKLNISTSSSNDCEECEEHERKTSAASSNASSGYSSQNSNSVTNVNMTVMPTQSHEGQKGAPGSPIPAPVWPRGHVAAQVEKLQQKMSNSVRPSRKIVPSDVRTTTTTSFPMSTPKVVVRHDPAYVHQVKIRCENNLNHIPEEEGDLKLESLDATTASVKRDGKYVHDILIGPGSAAAADGVAAAGVASMLQRPSSAPSDRVHNSVPAEEPDSIVTDALLQLTSLSTSNSSESRKDSTDSADLRVSPQRHLVATSPTSPEHELQRKREDMDKVISELTKAVMKSRNVTTLTRAMRNKYSSSDNGSQAASDTARSRRRNPLRNSIRTLRSISKGTKGSVDVVKNLWQQTGMKTNGGRKLLVASVEQTTSPNDGIDGSDDSGPPYRSVLVVSRTLSGGSSTTATYAEVYTSHKNSTNSEDSSTTSSSTSNSATETAKRKTVKFRESSRKKHDHVRSPVFVNRRSGGGGGSGSASHHLLKNADVIISVDQLQQQQQQLSHPNYWESYYGTDTAAAPDQKPYKSGNSTSSSSQSLYNTPYYDYRREQSKGGSGGGSANSLNSDLTIDNKGSTNYLVQKQNLIKNERRRKDQVFWNRFAIFIAIFLTLALVISVIIYFVIGNSGPDKTSK